MGITKTICYIVLKSNTDSKVEVLENDAPYRFCERNVGDILDKKFRWTIKDRIVKLLNDIESGMSKRLRIVACVNDVPMAIFTKKEFCEDRKHLMSEERYKMWRKSVYRRGRYKCCVCGDKDNELHAHHQTGWRLSPKLRYKVSNGVCLCKNCHLEFHSAYGKIANTPQELSEFIKSKNPEVLF